MRSKDHLTFFSWIQSLLFLTLFPLIFFIFSRRLSNLETSTLYFSTLDDDHQKHPHVDRHQLCHSRAHLAPTLAAPVSSPSAAGKGWAPPVISTRKNFFAWNYVDNDYCRPASEPWMSLGSQQQALLWSQPSCLLLWSSQPARQKKVNISSAF